MTEDEAKPYAKPIPNWIPETRTVIVCWMMFSSFLTIVLCWAAPPPPDSQLLNTLIGMYVGTGFITAITWWMGSSKGSDANNKMQDKMADAVLPPAPSPVVVSWWTKLHNDETNKIMAAGDTDDQVKKFIAAAKISKATTADLDYLVTKGLLTQDRATAIAAT